MNDAFDERRWREEVGSLAANLAVMYAAAESLRSQYEGVAAYQVEAAANLIHDAMATLAKVAKGGAA